MKRFTVVFLVFMICFISIGCARGINEIPSNIIEPLELEDSIVENDIVEDISVEDDISDFIIGVWKIQFAKNGTDGTDYPLQNLYGTGIQYGGTLTLNNDNTFAKLMGITDDTSDNEGTFSIVGNVITFKFKDGSTEEAVYLSSSQEIEYHTYDIFDTLIYEYFTKTE